MNSRLTFGAVLASLAWTPATAASGLDLDNSDWLDTSIVAEANFDADSDTAATVRGEGPAQIRWISNSNGNWHNADSWLGGIVPSDGDAVSFGVGENDLQVETVDTDNAGLGIDLPASTLRIERKMVFSDTSAGGDALLADDGLTFDLIQANGVGGAPVVFNVPVTADTITSNRHGAHFNREISVNSLLARSQHQDRWQINASATRPVSYLLIDENRGPDGDTIDGSFAINSDLIVEQLDQVWGHLIVGAESTATVQHYLYFRYANAVENNNINPITLDGNLNVTTFMVFDTALDTFTPLARGTYGGPGNEAAEVEVDFIAGDGGLLTVLGPTELFSSDFESIDPTLTSVR